MTKHSSPQVTEGAGGGDGVRMLHQAGAVGSNWEMRHSPAVTAAECACTATLPPSFSATAYLPQGKRKEVIRTAKGRAVQGKRATHFSATIHAYAMPSRQPTTARLRVGCSAMHVMQSRDLPSRSTGD